MTGASGFVGGHLIEALLADGWTVRCLVRRESNTRWIPKDRVEIFHGDVGTESTLPDAVRGVDAVFHLAAITSARDPADYARINAGGTRSVIEAMQATAPGAMLVLCSSQSAAGPSREGRPITEADTPRPIGPYGESKLAAEQLVIASNLKHIIIRPPAVYGPRDVDILFAFRLASAGIAVRVSSRGQKLSMIHVRDLAAGLVVAASAEHARGVYYMSGGTYAWEEIVQGIGAAVGRRARIIVLPRPLVLATSWGNRLVARIIHAKPLLTPERVLDMVQPDWSCDDSRARREIGYESSIPLDEGLAETAAWYRQAGWL
ncbi:MAG TPA: NAD-dependent epimerase/dehydratase family protein [Gemmatimonadaceae bacterium]|nr:NAD-dependent epimerase/dehydratase family protein [Gemmatimonadaceae bacterium]